MGDVYIFTAPMRRGPWFRAFSSVCAFDGYVKHWRENVGPVTFVGPRLCQGASS